MKALLRTCVLTAALTLSALAMAGHANADTNGTCRVLCTNPTTHTSTFVSVFTTSSQCCSSSFNPCPAGSNPGLKTFTPLSGGPQRCAA
jgi:hypothetical protein